jgi:hypothetical protein
LTGIPVSHSPKVERRCQSSKSRKQALSKAVEMAGRHRVVLKERPQQPKDRQPGEALV